MSTTIDPAPVVDPRPRLLFWRLTPLNARRWGNFKANRSGWWSLWIFLALLSFTLVAEFVSNDRPLLLKYDGELYVPVLKDYPESTFGGFLAQTDYRDPFIKEAVEDSGGWMIWPLIPYSYETINRNIPEPAPSRPTWDNPLGTDDQARDVLARVIYGFRVSVLFAVILTVFSTIIGIAAGAVQGYFGGRVDLYFQRVIEVWSALPVLYILIILASIVTPNFWWLLGIMLLFSWMGLVDVVRTEFLRARNFDYVRAARALGLTDRKIMWRHVLPNAMVATLTYLPFIVTGAVGTLTALDFLGFGLPPGSASLGELVKQGKNNLQAPWLGISAFITLSVMLTLLVFIGEAVRDAFDPRKAFANRGAS